MTGKLVASVICLTLFGIVWWSAQLRVRILGKSPAAQERTQRNTVLFGGMGILLLGSFWIPSVFSGAVYSICMLAILGTYVGMLVLGIRRQQASRKASSPPG